MGLRIRLFQGSGGPWCSAQLAGEVRQTHPFLMVPLRVRLGDCLQKAAQDAAGIANPKVPTC